MVDDMQARFLPRFMALAAERLRRALEVARGRRHQESLAVAGELHAMAGEAGLLGLAPVLAAARAAEGAAKRLAASRADADAERLAEALIALEGAVAELARR